MLPTITRMANAFALTDPAAPATAAKPVAPAVSLDPPELPNRPGCGRVKWKAGFCYPASLRESDARRIAARYRN